MNATGASTVELICAAVVIIAFLLPNIIRACRGQDDE